MVKAAIVDIFYINNLWNDNVLCASGGNNSSQRIISWICGSCSLFKSESQLKILDQQTDADHRRSEVWTEPVVMCFSSRLRDDIHLCVFKSQSLLGESARQQGETPVNIYQHSHMSNSLG